MDSIKNNKALFQRYLENGCTNSELDQLIGFFGTADETELKELISSALNDDEASRDNVPDYSQKLASIYQKIGDEIKAREDGNVRSLPQRQKYVWLRIAAAALLFISIGGYFLLHRAKPAQQIARQPVNNILPGHNQATLTLANGKKITLTRGLSGKLAQQGGTLIQVNDKNAIAYTSTSADANAPVEYNTLSTAKGEESPYPLVLPDGTKVWLNALSSITFPTAFNGKDRIVKVTGEAYFEVVHNRNKPFKVTVKGQTIQDIGTHFNINAYDDEPAIKTTLLEGSVKVSLANSPSAGERNSVTLTPGQQSVIHRGNNSINVKEIDIDDAVAWKNGMFSFNDADIKSIMRQLARWYNVEVAYPGNIPQLTFSGGIGRDLTLQQVLKVLEKSDVHFKIDNKKIIVTQ